MMKMLISYIRKLTQKENDALRKKTLLFVACIGIALIMIGNFFSMNQQNDASEIMENHPDDERKIGESPSIADIEQKYESDLVLLLNDVAGISDVSVMINVDSTYIQIYETEQISRQQIT